MLIRGRNASNSLALMRRLSLMAERRASPQTDALELWIVNLERKEGMLERVSDCIPVCWVPPEQMAQEVEEAGHGDIPRRDDLLETVK